MSSSAPPNSRAKGSKLFQQDIVAKISDPNYYGVVLRCWHDNEDFPPAPVADPMMRPLSYGEVGVTFISHDRERQILPESKLRLVDRTLQPGDYCKRSFDDVRAGVITDMKVKGKIRHAIKVQTIDRWFTTPDLLEKLEAEIGDYVAFDDWIGQVIEVFSQYLVQRPSGTIFQLPEIGTRFAVGESGTNIINNISDEQHGDGKDTVIAVNHSVYVVTWLALNQSLDSIVSANKSRPKRSWFGEDLAKLTLIRGRSDLEMRVGDRVHPKVLTDIPISEHGPAPRVGQGCLVATCLVTETLTEVSVLWQDGTTEVMNSVDLIPYLNPDEYDCWPGDHVLWRNEEVVRPAIVQSVNATERTALVLLPDTGAIELAPLLELDAHGTLDHTGSNPHAEVFGVRRGDFVFVHTPGTTNGLPNPRVPRIGEVEAWVREDPFDTSGWRQELNDIGLDITPKQEQSNCGHGSMRRPTKHDGKLHWCGEVTWLNLDGTVEVTHPDLTVKSYPLNQLTKLYDGIEQLEDDGWEEGSDGDHSYSDENEQSWAMDQDVEWDSMDAQVSEDEDDAIEVGEELRSSDRSMTEEDEQMNSNMLLNVDPVEEPLSQNSDFSAEAQAAESHTEDISDGMKWKRFEVLSSAPSDHFFYSSPPTQVSRTFLSRLSREYRVLRSSLPDSIIVRAYEDRTDLLRSLIIGPENTPYEDAPFVIDWLLDSNFPQGPPVAHFHSWTNGNGRVNPNLYEEGKVCLSILGTWSGDKDEVWSAARSSLLQAFVSIQGLVLVKEPWFCEPAFDKLRGTEEGTVNSRLYSEKAYVLSRGFVRRALELPPGGLEPEIRSLYFKEKRLSKVVNDAEKLIQKSRANQEVQPDDQDVAVPRLSAGGIISLERTLAKLRPFLSSSV